MTRIKSVILEVPQLGMKRAFSISHAERLLSIRDNGGWQLPENSPFEYSKEYGIRVRTNKKHSAETK